jgi:hypothetical protein
LFSGVFALFMLFQGGPPPADQPLRATWSVSPQGAGSTLVPAAGDKRDGWEVHDVVGRADWLRFNFISGAPCLLINTSGRVLYSLQGDFIVTNMRPNPFMVEFTTSAKAVSDWGQPLVVTITAGP